MSILIVGADRISSIRERLEAWGATQITHWDARKASTSKAKIPVHTDLVVFFTDYLHHNAALQLKRQVKARSLRAIYCRRAWSELSESLDNCLLKDCRGCKNAHEKMN